MWTRKELKTSAKAIFKANYLHAVIAAVVFSFINGAFAKGAENSSESSGEDISTLLQSLSLVEVFTVISMGSAFIAIMILINIFVKNPLQVGYYSFLLSCREEGGASFTTMFSSAIANYLSFGLKTFTTDLICCLWSILFIIPGIYKMYQYRLVPCLLAEDPDLSAAEARRISREMMNGNKMAAFILDLSFIPWHILGCITFGIVEILWVAPYVGQTDCELYKTLRDRSSAL